MKIPSTVLDCGTFGIKKFEETRHNPSPFEGDFFRARCAGLWTGFVGQFLQKRLAMTRPEDLLNFVLIIKALKALNMGHMVATAAALLVHPSSYQRFIAGFSM